MPLVSRWNRLSLVWQLAALCCLLLVVIGALTFSLLADNQSKAAGNKAKDAVTCVNNALAERNTPSQNDAAAHIAFAQEQSRFADALANVLNASKSEGPMKYVVFLAEVGKYEQASQAYATALAADQKLRDEHPLGKC